MTPERLKEVYDKLWYVAQVGDGSQEDALNELSEHIEAQDKRIEQLTEHRDKLKAVVQSQSDHEIRCGILLDKDKKIEQLEKDKDELIQLGSQARSALQYDIQPKMDGSHIGKADEAISVARRILKKIVGFKYTRQAIDNARGAG